MKPSAQILAADIGGTRARFLLAPSGPHDTPSTGASLELPSRESGDIEQLLDAALAKLGARNGGDLDAALAVAGPVRAGRARLTNLSWDVDAQRLQRRYGFRHVALMNDLQAAARALAERPPVDAVPLRAGVAGEDRRAVIAVGTGLGVAYWQGSGSALCIDASEAGHLAFAAAEPWELDYLQVLQRRHGGRVVWEHLLSGSGLAELEAHIRGGAAVTPAEVAHRAASGDTAALTALQRLSWLLGRFAGDLALTAPAWGGVWLAGGVLASLGPLFDSQPFLEAFDAKGPCEHLMQGVPLWRTDDRELGVRGAWLTACAWHHEKRRELWASS